MNVIALALVAAWTGPAPAAPPAEPAQTREDVEALWRQVSALEAQLAETEARLEALESPSPERAPSATLLSAEAEVIAAGETVPDAVSFARPLEVRGRISGSAVAFGGDVRIRNGAHVEGDAVSFGGRVLIDEGGALDGDRVTLGDVSALGEASTGSLIGALPTPKRSGGLTGLVHHLSLALAFAGLGVLVVGAFPRQVDTIAHALEAHPLRSGLVGLGLSGLGALMMLAFTLTLIGVPVAVLIGGLLTAAWAMGFISLCLAAGDRLPWLAGPRRWIAFLLGSALFTGLVSLPWIGEIALVLLGFACVGAAAKTRLGTSPADG